MSAKYPNMSKQPWIVFKRKKIKKIKKKEKRNNKNKNKVIHEKVDGWAYDSSSCVSAFRQNLYHTLLCSRSAFCVVSVSSHRIKKDNVFKG